MRFTSAIAAGALAVGALAGDNYLGFNSGATKADRSAKFKQDFVDEFTTAANLNGAPGDFNAVRLYTNIQAYSDQDPIEAFDAAVETNTKVLLGVWASGVTTIDKEVAALKAAIAKHGSDLTDLVIGVNIGSEDLYRISKTGIKNKSGVGNGPDAIVGFIQDWRKAFKNTALSSVPVGHADTWDSWNNSTNSAVIEAIDFLSVHEYPYYENDKGNDIDNAGNLFDKAYQATIAAANGKPVWVTETGWPYVGPKWDEAVASVKNAKKYWDEVGCRKLFNKTPTFWYTLRDSNPDNEMKFAITNNLSTEPRFNLTCPTHFETDDKTTTSSSAKSTKTKTASSASTMTTVTNTAATATSTSDSGSESDSDSSSIGGGSSTSGPGSGSSNGGSGSSTTMTGTQAGSSASTTPSTTPEGAAASLKVSALGVLAVAAGALALF